MLKPGDPAPPFDLPCAIAGVSRVRASRRSTPNWSCCSFIRATSRSSARPKSPASRRALADSSPRRPPSSAASVDNVDSHRRWAASWAESLIRCSPTRVASSRAPTASSTRRKKWRCARPSSSIASAWCLFGRVPHQRRPQRRRDSPHRARASHRPALPGRLDAGHDDRPERAKVLGRLGRNRSSGSEANFRTARERP